MKTRRHHNNKGHRQIKRGSCEKQIRFFAKKLGLKYKKLSEANLNRE